VGGAGFADGAGDGVAELGHAAVALPVALHLLTDAIPGLREAGATVAGVRPVLPQAAEAAGEVQVAAAVSHARLYLRILEPLVVAGDGDPFGVAGDSAPPCLLVHRPVAPGKDLGGVARGLHAALVPADRKSTRLNSSHVSISYAVLCLK